MSDRSQLISKLKTEQKSRAAYIKAKLGVLVPSQIRALRLKSNMPRQQDLAEAAHMQQSRISMFETPGSANVTLDTLARLAAVFKVGLLVKFVPFSETLRWENAFSQDEFNVIRLDEDVDFIAPTKSRFEQALLGEATTITDKQYLSRTTTQIGEELFGKAESSHSANVTLCRTTATPNVDFYLSRGAHQGGEAA